MPMIVLAISLAVLMFGIFLYSMSVRIIEEDHTFKTLIVGFFLVYILGAFLVWWQSPKLDEPSDIAGFLGNISQKLVGIQLSDSDSGF